MPEAGERQLTGRRATTQGIGRLALFHLYTCLREPHRCRESIRAASNDNRRFPQGVTVTVVVCAAPAYSAVMLIAVFSSTAAVIRGNVAIDKPAGTKTEEGRLARSGRSLASCTCTPPIGALALRYTAPVTVAPPATRSCPKYAP